MLLTPGGKAQRLAGTGEPGFSGDGGPARSSQLNSPLAVAIVPAGVAIADTGNDRVRLVRPDGTIVSLATVHRPVDLAPLADGGLAVAAADGRVWRARPGGHDLALLASFGSDPALAAAGDGALFVAEPRTRRIWRVAPDGTRRLVKRLSCSLVASPAGMTVLAGGAVVLADAAAGASRR